MLLAQIQLLLLFISCALVAGIVEELNSESLQKIKETSKDRGSPHLVMFYAPWCHFSKKAIPQFQLASEKFAANYPSLKFAKIDAHKYVKKLYGFVIRGYPTVLLLVGEKSVEYPGDVTVDGLKKFVAEKLA